jgi:hypothetical protein
MLRFRDRFTVPMQLRRRVRLLALCLAAVAIVLVSAVPASAATGPNEPAPPGSGNFLESWALAPTGTDPSQPSSRANLSYTVDKGSSVKDSVSLWNYSDVQLTFHVYATDAYNNVTGEFTLLPSNIKPKNAGTWFTLQTNYVTVPSRTRVDIPFTMTVPNDATPGDHIAGIVASVPTGATNGAGQHAIVDRRTGSRAYVRVNGPVNPSLVAENLSTVYHGAFNPLDGSLDVSWTLRNAGNVRLGARQQVSVTDVLGRELDSRRGKLVQELLPGNAVRLHERFTGVPATFRVGANVKVTPIEPAGVAGKPPAPETYGSKTWAIPWTVLLLLLLALLLWRLYRRYRRREESPPMAAGGSAGGGGPGVPPGASSPRTPESVLHYRPTDPGGRPVP